MEGETIADHYVIKERIKPLGMVKPVFRYYQPMLININHHLTMSFTMANQGFATTAMQPLPLDPSRPCRYALPMTAIACAPQQLGLLIIGWGLGFPS